MVLNDNLQTLQKNKYSHFTVFQWNCRSLGKNLPYLIQELHDNNYDVLILQALNLKSVNTPKLSGYYYPPITQTKPEVDKLQTAIYVATNFQYSQLTIHDLENLDDVFYTAAKLHLNKEKTINIVSVYFPQGPSNTNTDWLKSINKSNLNNEKWIIGGDYNAHSPLWEENCKTTTNKQLVENITDSDLIVLNDGSITRIPDNPNHKATSIDLTLASPSIYHDIQWYTLNDTLGSDHIPIITTLSNKHSQSTQNPKDSNFYFPKFNYNKANWDDYQITLRSTEFPINKIDTSDINESYTVFQRLVLTAAYKAIPTYKTYSKSLKVGNSWWTEECKTAVNEKKKAYKKYIKNKTPDNLEVLKQAKYFCNKVIKDAKKKLLGLFLLK